MSLRRRYRPFTLTRPGSAANVTTTPVAETAVGTFRGFIQPQSGNEQQRSNGLQEQYSDVLYCDLKVPIRYGDIVTQSGTKYRVVYATQARGISAVEHHKEILLRYEG